MITVAHTCSASLIAIDNINTVCEIGLYIVLWVLIKGIATVIICYTIKTDNLIVTNINVFWSTCMFDYKSEIRSR